MKLYNLPKGARIKAEAWTTHDNGDKEKLGDFVIFDHVDGMYSYCYVEGREDEILHLLAAQPLKAEEDYYVLDNT